MKSAKELLDHRNMMIAVKKGVVPRKEFRDALWEQRRLFTKDKAYTPLTKILQDRGVITESQIEEVLFPLYGRAFKGKTQASSPDGHTEKSVECPLPEKESTEETETGNGCLAGPSRKGASLIVAKDGLAAFISARGTESERPSLKDVHRLLADKNIVFGIMDDQQIQTKLEEALAENTSFQIAAGYPPKIGEPDQVTYHFDTNPFRVGTVKDDGMMDWKERGEYPHIEKDAVLATIIPGKKSEQGKDIFGHALAVDEVPRLHLFAGKGVAKSEDRLQLIAKVSGQPQLAGRGNVSVIQTLEIKSDIGIETGHVDFEGHIEVRGAVEKGYRVKGDSLRAREILSDQVEISGDVVAMRGIFGANIRCGGRVKANHLNKSTIMAEDDVVVAKEVVDCKIITNGKCILDGGTILSSEIYAKKGLKAGSVGSEAAHPSKLVVGIDQIAKIKVAEFKDEIFENKEKITDMEKEITSLNEKSDHLNTELGQIAQIQDKHMVDRRKITDVLEKEKRNPSAEEQAAISALSLKMEEIDKAVEDLMSQDEEAQAKVVNLRNEILQLEERINALDEEIKEIELFAARDMGIPSVQVTGKLYHNTQIEGPNDALTIEKTTSSITLKEQKNMEKDAEKPYSFKVSKR